MDEPTRRAWSKPELIVLVRSGQQEAVLTECRTTTSGADGPDASLNGCRTVVECAPCGMAGRY